MCTVIIPVFLFLCTVRFAPIFNMISVTHIPHQDHIVDGLSHIDGWGSGEGHIDGWDRESTREFCLYN